MGIFASSPAPSPAPEGEQPAAPPRRRRTDGMPLSIVAPDMTIIGDLDTDGTVKIEGRVRGTIRATTQILVAHGALIEGDLHTREAIIAGEVHGAIHATQRVELQATAAVTGDITTQRLAILEGGRVTGELKMDLASGEEAAAAPPAPHGRPKLSVEA